MRLEFGRGRFRVRLTNAAENGWDRDQFLTYLCAHKAGIEPDAWKDPKTEIYTFSAEVFGEKKIK